MDLSSWLNDRSALATLTTTVVAAAGVLVAWFYAILTRRLWRATLGQAEQARRQADTTERMLDATYRPFVEVTWGDGVFRDADHYGFSYQFKAHGQLPALLLGWGLQIEDAAGSVITHQKSAEGWRRVMYPGNQLDLEVTSPSSQPWSSGGERTKCSVSFTILYRGRPLTSYNTRFDMIGSRGSWTLRDYQAS